jgi:phosphotransacetylase
MSYIVVFKTIAKCNSTGAITWSSFESKEKFNEWNDEEMKSWYHVIAEDVTVEQAKELCSTPEATLAAMLYKIKEACELLKSKS